MSGSWVRQCHGLGPSFGLLPGPTPRHVKALRPMLGNSWQLGVTGLGQPPAGQPRLLPPEARSREPLRGDSGQAGIAVIAALMAILAVLGLAVDGAALVTTKIGLAGDADGAARAAVSALDPAVLATTGQAQLDPAAADAAARAYAGSVCPQCTVSTVPGTGAFTVTLRRQVSTFFLQALGIREVTVAASSTASPVKP